MLPYSKFQKLIAEKRISPNKTVFDSILKITPGRSHDGPCHQCGTNSDFKCGMCMRMFCHKCMKESDAKETRDGQIVTAVICSACITKKTSCGKKFPLYEAMKLRMIRTMYPFISRNLRVCDMWSVVNWSGVADEIQSRFIYEPPVGMSGENAEIVLDPENRKLWDPRETYISLALSFKQTFDITCMVIHCAETVIVDCDGCQSLVFHPPVTELKVSLQCQQLNMRLQGKKIMISRISLHGKPTNETPATREPQIELMKRPMNVYNVGMKFDRAEERYELKMDHPLRVCGFNFASLEGVKELFIICANAREDELFRFVVPKTKSTVRLMLPVVYECSFLTVWYVARGACNMQLTQIITEGSMNRAKSMLVPDRTSFYDRIE